MNSPELMAISPLDGRYHDRLTNLRPLFSEFGLIRLRVQVEVQWLIMLASHSGLPECPPLSQRARKLLEQMAEQFSEEDARRVKHIESSIRHDVKSVEYFIKEHIEGNTELAHIREFIHFGCTSDDINNLAYGVMLLTARQQFILPALDTICDSLKKLAHQYASQPMLARTHGQPATPTTLGKEIANVLARLHRQIAQLSRQGIPGKLNGASGNYNALHFACPEVDWQLISKNFVSSLGLEWNAFTTQIEPHDGMSEYFSILIRINIILIDFCRDMWGYISLGYFHQKNHNNEVGSSIMPHKINPIDFENAEGNLGISNALLDHMIQKLPISRWQRDLTDSTVQRNIGTALAHSVLAFESILNGLYRAEPNTHAIQADLETHWEILAEPIQTLMRRYNLEAPYEQLKKLTRGKQLDKTTLHEWIHTLSLPDDARKKLLELTPEAYYGLAGDLASRI